jgi:hypothetical protein
MNKFNEHDLIRYINKLGVVGCKIKGEDCYVLEVTEDNSSYYLIAKASDMKLVAKPALNLNIHDIIWTTKGKGIITNIINSEKETIYEIFLEDFSLGLFQEDQLWEEIEERIEN